MRNAIKLGGPAILAMLVIAGAASAQTMIQPQYRPGAGSSQSFLYQPGPTSGTDQATRSPASPSQGSMPGPVTGYGAGGMVRAPGTPLNPPYFRGGAGANGR
jgi:hypothetical protein